MGIILEAKDLTKRFGGLTAVDQVSIQVQQHEVYGIIGPNGAGKTTFFNLLTGVLPVSSGEVLFKEERITNLPPDQVVRMGMARTFQNIKLFKYMTVLDNVKIGFHTQTRSNVFDSLFRTKRFKQDEKLVIKQGMAVLERVGLADLAQEYAANLAYGTQRRLEIARALATNPDLLLLDEPAAGMNPVETSKLMEFIRQLNTEGLTVVIIEHDMRMMMNLCDRMTVLNYGQKICQGTPSEVQTNKAVIEAYLGTGMIA